MRGVALDFVISKVAMSVCALFVASLLGPALANSQHHDTDSELEDIIVRLARVVSAAMIDGLEADAAQHLPRTISGEAIRVDLRSDSFIAVSESERASCQLCAAIHLWIWNGSGLRSSVLDELDRTHSMVSAVSGDVVKVSTRWVPIDSTPTLLTFVWIERPSGGQSLLAISSIASANALTSSDVL